MVSASVLLLPAALAIAFAAHSYSRHQLIRVQINSARDFSLVQRWADHFSTQIDVWNSNKEHVDIMVSPEHQRDFKRSMKRHKLPYRVLVQDVQKLLDDPKSGGTIDSLRFRRFRRSADIDINAFNNYSDIVNYLWSLDARYPGLAQSFNMSGSYEGRSLVGVKLGRWRGVGNKPAIWIDGGMHAREWLSPATALHIIHTVPHPPLPFPTRPRVFQLLAGSEGDSEAARDRRWLLDHFDVYVLPLMNPDGYVYTMSESRFWRKTRSEQGQHHYRPRATCRGVDLNRNFGHHWGEVGATKHFPCSEIYAGSESFCEPEAEAVRQYVESLLPELKLYLSFHAYGQLFLSPWGYSLTHPEDHQDHRNLAMHGIEAIRRTTNATYQYGTIAGFMYEASGTSIDYFYEKGVKYSYAVELRPTEDEIRGFLATSEDIEVTGGEMLAAVVAMARALLLHDAQGRPPTDQS